MATERISILDAIKAGDVNASLFTTFNANLKFYEDLILRRLTAAGSRNNVVVMDQKQCALACASAATRPSLAGVGYTLVPVSVSGAFHPKICMLAGKQRASLFIGSQNLTISGFGYNREVSSFHRISGLPGSPARRALTQAWGTVRQWLGRTDLPSALLESAYKLDQAFGVHLSDAPEGDATLLAQDAGSAGLLDQLAAMAPAQVKDIALIGAFFDTEGRFISELLRRWPSARIVIGVEPGTVCLSRLPEDERLKVVDAGDLGRAGHDGYLHAKAVYFEGIGGDALFACGSANPSAPAWMSSGVIVNTEAMVVRTDDDARKCASEIGMDRLPSIRPLPKKVLFDIMTRSRAEFDEPRSQATPVFIAIADHANQTISVDASRLPAFDRVDACDDADRPLIAGLGWTVPGTLRVERDFLQIRSLVLHQGDSPIARVLVHHPQVIDRQIKRAGQDPTIELLRALGSDIEDISRVLPALERVIFADGVANVLRVPARRNDGQTHEEAIAGPETLRVPLAAVGRKPAPSLFAASHDLAYLIEILTRNIDVGAAPAAPGLNRSGRSEEEQIGQDDEEDLLPTPDVRQPVDADIGDAVCRRVGKLCRRMSRALKAAPHTQQAAAGLVVQLVAVLALLQELSKLELTDRWRVPHIDLFWVEDLEGLVDTALDRLFVSEEGVELLCDEEAPEEVIHLVGLMLWAAWLLDYEWWSPQRRRLDTSEQEERASLNARLVGLLTMAGEHDIWGEVRLHIERGMARDLLTLSNAVQWFERHLGISKALVALGPSLPEVDRIREQIAAGDVVDVPDVIDRLLVAISTDGNYVHVGSGGQGRSFTANRVRLRARV
ncbi:hypothetical protein [Stenotrophomonas sp. VV52]|uniref:hypothetical protein n=1 Tax=Stenotrophomonas sp. VV52 TaxID=2066958 RepID=UPI000C9E3F81|nr:hypothetical protein [Stenotrophomonas sp. VV52]